MAKKVDREAEMLNNSVSNDDVIDISLDAIRKKRFRIDGDNNRILELDTSDLSVINRVEDSYSKLNALAEKASLLKTSTDENSDDDSLDEAVERVNSSQLLREIDSDMRNIIDYIFDANVSEVCAPSGSMFDPFNGEFRYEHIVDTVLKLYENNLSKEFALMKKKIQKHTDKYVGKH